MRIELKKIKLYEEWSEETEAFKAELFVESKLFALVGNRGTGGENDIDLVEGVSHADLKKLNEWCMEHLPTWFLGKEYNPENAFFPTTLEIHISNLVDEEVKKKQIKRILRGNIVIVDDLCDPAEGEHYKTPKKGLDATSLQNVLSHHKNPIILNDLHPLEAHRLLHKGKLRFSIEGWEDNVYLGVDYGSNGGCERWNGWLVPAVTKNVFEEILKYYTCSADCSENLKDLHSITPTTNGLYVLNMGWVWDEHDEA